MSAFWKILLRILGSVVVLAIVLSVLVVWRSGAHFRRRYQIPVAPPVVPSGAAAIARGHHLAATRGCLVCHGSDLGGAKVIDDPAMGRLYGPNLTRGRGGLPASYSDADFVRAIRHGVGADGRGLFLMPSADYARFSVEDMGELIAYIRSVPPVDRARVPLKVGPVARTLIAVGKIKFAAEVIDHAAVKPDEVEPAVTAAYGRYVSAACTGCHRANFSGGKIDIGPPGWPPAANLTPAGHLAHWTEADFIAALRTGRRPDHTEINPVMPRSFGLMNDVELKALWAFFQTLPPAPTGR